MHCCIAYCQYLGFHIFLVYHVVSFLWYANIFVYCFESDTDLLLLTIYLGTMV